MRWLDALLDRITMYRLLLYYLLALLGVAALLGVFGYLPYSSVAILFSAAYLCAICWISNAVFGWAYAAPTNLESPLITGLILALIITPIASTHNLLFLTAAAGLAMASKYMLAIRKQHIFNPAAVAVALTSLGAGQSASWWVGTGVMLPWVVVGGLLLVRKIQRIQMVASFLVVSLIATVGYNLIGGGSVGQVVQTTLLHSSLFFLAFVMLTEPLTSPATLAGQRWYAVLAGALFPPQVHVARLYSTPELVLVVSNVFSYIVSPKAKLLPRLTHKTKLAPDVMDFRFALERPLRFEPGQYMEWTLPHRGSDARGTRRYFTLASSPTEDSLQLGIKFYPNGSSFKRALLAMDAQTPIAAGQLSGDFVLPKDPTQKLAFIAGGIGITPFRSMIKYLVDTKQARPVTLLYSERSADELVYTDVFAAAQQQLGIKTVYAVDGVITADTIKAELPDYAERLFYISGPHAMVTAMTDILHGLGVHHRQIKTDFFPGYV